MGEKNRRKEGKKVCDSSLTFAFPAILPGTYSVVDLGFLKGGFNFAQEFCNFNSARSWVQKTKQEKVIHLYNLFLSQQPCFLVFLLIILYQCDCSTKESRFDCSIRIFSILTWISKAVSTKTHLDLHPWLTPDPHLIAGQTGTMRVKFFAKCPD